MIVSLVILATLTFFLLRFLPGGPFDETAALHPLVKENLSQQWALQESFPAQISHYLVSAFQGKFGVSLVHPDQTVMEIIARSWASSLGLCAITLIFVLLGSLTVVFLSVRFRGTWFETWLDQSMIAMLSLPSLFWGPLLIYLFGFYFNLLPVAFLSSPAHYILPVLTLGFRPLAILVRLLKSSVTENLDLDYVRTARAKGVSFWNVIFHHVLRNSLIPFLSYVGNIITSLMSGSFLVEMLFAIPGLGSQFIAALADRDYTLIVGLTLVYGALLIIINSLMDILMRWADPRLRESA